MWGVFLSVLAYRTRRHLWIMSVFAIGLGAPRWCQMLWATPGVGLYIPWAGGLSASAIVGRVLWLWLGLLDGIQSASDIAHSQVPTTLLLNFYGVLDIGMILLNTLTRFHILFTLLAGQAFGSIATILGRATAPDRIGPGYVFPNFSIDPSEGLSKTWFWIALLFQLSTNGLCFVAFRWEQQMQP